MQTLPPGQVLSASAGRMWSALGGFVDGLTGAGVGALWDGGHCSCERLVESVWCCADKPRSCRGV